MDYGAVGIDKHRWSILLAEYFRKQYGIAFRVQIYDRPDLDRTVVAIAWKTASGEWLCHEVEADTTLDRGLIAPEDLNALEVKVRMTT